MEQVNQAIATLYARHVLAALLAEWPAGQPLSDEALELSGSSHMAYILDMLVQLEEKTLWEKVRAWCWEHVGAPAGGLLDAGSTVGGPVGGLVGCWEHVRGPGRGLVG